jgi:hypothetical protein
VPPRARRGARSGRVPSALPPTRAVGWVERLRETHRRLPRGRAGSMGFAFRSTHPTQLPIHDVKQRSLLRSRRAFLRPGSFASSSLRILRPEPRGGRSAGRRYLHFVALVRRDTTFARRGRPEANRDGPLGAPPWRFLARSARCGCGVASGTAARATFAAGCRARSDEGPEPPGHGLRAAAGTPLPAPPAGSSPEDAPHERG